MPSPIVKVTFDGSNWTFDPVVSHVGAPGPVIVKRDPGTATWTLESVGNLPSGYTQNRQADGAQISIYDPHTPPFGVDMPYTVTVLFNGATYTSPLQGVAAVPGGPPPMIVNDVTMTERH